MNDNQKNKTISTEKSIKKICKERGWNPDELTTGQMLFVINQIKKSK
jgi:hypothetical protein